ncbi:hemolysin family protein [Amycolatopsis plumensis]
MTVLNILLGVAVVLALTAATGYFVAQEFAYMAIDRSRLQAGAAAGDAGAKRALDITRRTSFMLSGAQLGITVTGLLVGYVAEPLIGGGIGELLAGIGLAPAAGLAVGTVIALGFSTIVQMVFGELFPKNLAIARPEPLARRLAWSTRLYLGALGWLITLFDKASNVLLRWLKIEPVHDVEHAATARDLEHIVAESRETGHLPAELSTLLDRALDLHERTAEHAMIPRPRVATVSGGLPLADVVTMMATGHSRYPVVGEDVDDVLGVIDLRDVLRLDEPERRSKTAADLAKPAVLVPASLPLPAVLTQLRDADEQLACVVDEYGGLAGVVTVEDIGEELIGEIGDEHDLVVADEPHPAADGSWTVPGELHIDEAERLLELDLPRGDYETIAGLVITELGRLPDRGDTVSVSTPDGDRLVVTVTEVERHVPATVRIVREVTA